MVQYFIIRYPDKRGKSAGTLCGYDHFFRYCSEIHWSIDYAGVRSETQQQGSLHAITVTGIRNIMPQPLADCQPHSLGYEQYKGRVADHYRLLALTVIYMIRSMLIIMK